METTNLIEPLLERFETYSKASFELLKLRSFDKIADISSTFISRFILLIIVLLFVFTLSVAIALWLGELLGKNYYGFLIVATFYGLIGIVILSIHSFIKSRINNSIITLLFN